METVSFNRKFKVITALFVCIVCFFVLAYAVSASSDERIYSIVKVTEGDSFSVPEEAVYMTETDSAPRVLDCSSVSVLEKDGTKYVEAVCDKARNSFRIIYGMDKYETDMKQICLSLKIEVEEADNAKSFQEYVSCTVHLYADGRYFSSDLSIPAGKYCNVVLGSDLIGEDIDYNHIFFIVNKGNISDKVSDITIPDDSQVISADNIN